MAGVIEKAAEELQLVGLTKEEARFIASVRNVSNILVDQDSDIHYIYKMMCAFNYIFQEHFKETDKIEHFRDVNNPFLYAYEGSHISDLRNISSKALATDKALAKYRAGVLSDMKSIRLSPHEKQIRILSDTSINALSNNEFNSDILNFASVESSDGFPIMYLYEGSGDRFIEYGNLKVLLRGWPGIKGEYFCFKLSLLGRFLNSYEDTGGFELFPDVLNFDSLDSFVRFANLYAIAIDSIKQSAPSGISPKINVTD